MAVEDPVSAFAVAGLVFRGARGAFALAFFGEAGGRPLFVVTVVEDCVRTLMEVLGRTLKEVPGRVVVLSDIGTSETVLRKEAALSLLFACRGSFDSVCAGAPRADAYRI